MNFCKNVLQSSSLGLICTVRLFSGSCVKVGHDASGAAYRTEIGE